MCVLLCSVLTPAAALARVSVYKLLTIKNNMNTQCTVDQSVILTGPNRLTVAEVLWKGPDPSLLKLLMVLSASTCLHACVCVPGSQPATFIGGERINVRMTFLWHLLSTEPFLCLAT